MQPYFFPYIGYFQLIAAVDLFIVYDNIKYTKKGWINRNRMLLGGKDAFFTVPLKSDSDYLDVRDRVLADDFNRDKLLNRFRGAYGRAPHFAEVFPMVERATRHQDMNLFQFLHHALISTCAHLDLTTSIRVSSTIEIDPGLKNQDKVIALAKAVGATTYINPIGGLELYDRRAFREEDLDLQFVRSMPVEYRQFSHPFVPWLSIIDVLMFNPVKDVQAMVRTRYELV
jgi:hypothetical protein